jgi:hypothetical protein
MRLGRLGRFGDAPLEILEILVHLFKGKSDSKQAFRDIPGQVACQAFQPKVRDLVRIGFKGAIHFGQRGRRAPPYQGNAGRA